MRPTPPLPNTRSLIALLITLGLTMLGCADEGAPTTSEIVTETPDAADDEAYDDRLDERASAVWIMGMPQKLDPAAFGVNSPDGLSATATRPGGDAVALDVRYDETGWLEVDVPLEMPMAPDYTFTLFSSAPDGAGSESDVEVTVGSLIGIRWNAEASQEELFRLDPMTGETFTYGVVGDLNFIQWTYPMLVDPERGLIYVDGFDANSDQKLYTMDMWTGDLLDTVALEQPTAGWEINSEGSIVFFRWNEGAQVEEMLRLDPTTGDTELMGTVGDLEFWSQETVIDNAANRIYAFGKTGLLSADPDLGLSEEELEALSPEELAALQERQSGEQDILYIMDSLTGELLERTTLSARVGAPRIVY